MLPTSFNEVTAADIESLIELEMPESLTLEYKQELPSKDQRKEFLCDIAAMANAGGGDYICGIVERRDEENKTTGIPEKLTGLRIANEQEDIIRLSSCIRDTIAPRLVGVAIRRIVCTGGDVLVIRVPSSWNKPHMVTVGSGDRFFKRTGAAKNPMSVDEIRRAFSEQGELRETIARWRTHRVELVEKDCVPVPLSAEVAMLFHVIPANAFSPGIFNEAWRLPDDEKKQVFVPTGNYYQRYNADGFVCHSSRDSAGVRATNVYRAYTQLFRSGIVEYGFSNFYYPPEGRTNPMIVGQEVEQQIVNCYNDAIARFRRQGEFGNVYVGFSLVGIQETNIYITPFAWSNSDSTIRQNTFISPEVYVDLNEPEEHPFERTLRPLVDTFWQLDGREGTPFMVDGHWEPFRRYQ